MKNPVLDYVENKYSKKNDVPQMKAGDTVQVHTRIREGTKERIQVYEGIVIKHKKGGMNEAVTVRKLVGGVGVEKTFPVHSTLVDKIEVAKYGNVRRSRLYYLRDLIGSKATRVKEDLEKNIQVSLEKKEQKKAATQAKQKAKAEESAKENSETPAADQSPDQENA
jgi:large subunit ribosomal protein L19